jgi:hypothetical protein
MKRMLLTLSLSAAALAGPAEEDHHHEAGPSLGTLKIGDYEIEALQQGKIDAGKECVFEIKIIKGAPEPKAIRAWIGVETGRGSMKAKSHKHGDEISIHCEVPDPVPEGSKLWIELETDAGKTRGSLDYRKD